MKSIPRRLTMLVALALAFCGLVLATRRYGSVEWLAQNETHLREFVNENSVYAWLIGLATYIGVSLVPGTGGKAVVFGWLFGFWRAVLLVDVALTVAAVATFLISRFLIQDIAQQRFVATTERINRGLQRDGVFYLLMARLAHVPYTLVNYAAGATAVPILTFTWTTAAGLLPGTMVFVFLGTQIPTLREIADHGVLRLLDPMLITVLIAAIVLPATVHWAIRRFDLLHWYSVKGPNHGID